MKEQNSKKKKVVTAVVATVMAAALLLGGTFAWQSISQTALNEKDDTINPGGRLHDDFNGTNKDIYVENFADENIYARVRLDEYFEVIANKGTPAESVKVITAGATKGDTSTYVTHKFDSENVTDNYWNWTTGGQTKYMPTFNKNKDSLAADINGTYEQDFDDYVDYNTVDVEEDGAIYDNDDNDIEDDGVTTIQETHNTKDTLAASLISMSEWLQLSEAGENTDNYWVYDTDGWVYWSSAIEPETATGLLLDKIQLSKVMDDSYYYAINVTAQFITADDVGAIDNTGFYDESQGSVPTPSAKVLLETIGVDMSDVLDDSDDTDESDIQLLSLQSRDPDFPYPYTLYNTSGNIKYLYDLDANADNIFDLTLSEGVTLNGVNFEKTIVGTSYNDGVITLAAGDGQSFTISVKYASKDYEFKFVPIFETIEIPKDATAETKAYNITGGYYTLIPKGFDADAVITYKINEPVNRSEIVYSDSTYGLSMSSYESTPTYTITATDENGNSGTVKITPVDVYPYDGMIFFYYEDGVPYGAGFIEDQTYTWNIGKRYLVSANMPFSADATLTWTITDASGNPVSKDKIGFVDEGSDVLKESATTDIDNGVLTVSCTNNIKTEEQYILKATSDKEIYKNEGVYVSEYKFYINFQNQE